MSLIEKKFLLALFLTLAVEGVCFFILVNYFSFFKSLKEIKWSTNIFSVIFASSLTLPYIWFIFPYFIFNRGLYLLVSEFFAFFVETIFYKEFLKISYKQALIISFLCNFFSLILGSFL